MYSKFKREDIFWLHIGGKLSKCSFTECKENKEGKCWNPSCYMWRKEKGRIVLLFFTCREAVSHYLRRKLEERNPYTTETLSKYLAKVLHRNVT